MQCWVPGCQYADIAGCKASFYDISLTVVPCHDWLSRADKVLLKEKSGPHLHTKWGEREHNLCHMNPVNIIWKWILLLMLAVGDIQYVHCIATLDAATVVFVNVPNHLPPVLG